MRRQRTAGVVCALLVATALSGCAEPGHEPAGFESTAPGYGEVFLGPGDCSTRGRDFREVSCGGERAVARVLSRYEGPPADGPVCPEATDFVLYVSENRPAADEDGDGAVARGYACMRNLQPPHPGDPGGGGGPYTVVGDCLTGSREGQVRETACDGSGEARPEYRVVRAVQRRAQCPASTDLYVELGRTAPVGCARRV